GEEEVPNSGRELRRERARVDDDRECSLARDGNYIRVAPLAGVPQTVGRGERGLNEIVEREVRRDQTRIVRKDGGDVEIPGHNSGECADRIAARARALPAAQHRALRRAGRCERDSLRARERRSARPGDIHWEDGTTDACGAARDRTVRARASAVVNRD